MHKISRWLSSINPFRSYYEYKIRVLETEARVKAIERIERQEEKAAFLTSLQAIASVAVESAKASQAQAGALATFLNSFNATDPPRVREWDEEAANKRYIEQHMPAEMQGLDAVDRFQLLLDKVEENWLGDN